MRIGLRERGVAASSVAGVALRSSQLLATLVTLPVLIKHLGLAGFGIWGAATSLVWLIGMLDLGIGNGLVVTLPRAISEGQPDRAKNLVGAALFAGLCAAIALCTACVTFLVASGQFAFSDPLVLAAAALALNVPLSISGRAWLSVHKGYVAWFWEFVQTLLALALILWGALRGAGVTLLVAAVYGALLAANAASLAHFLVSNPELRPAMRVSVAAVREVVAKGALLFAATAASLAAYAFDNVLTLAWLGPIASSEMTIAMRVCTTAAGFLAIISWAFWPAFVDAMARGENAWIQRTLSTAFWTLTGLAVFGSAILVAIGGPVLRWWLHRDIHLGAVTLWVMAGWIVAMSLPLMPGLIAASGGRLRGLVATNVTTAVTALLAKAPLAKAWGVTGMLVSTPLCALVVAFPVTLWLARASIKDLSRRRDSPQPSDLTR